MRFFVVSVVIASLLLSCGSVLAQDSSCECAICHNGYIAICHYDTGRCIGECVPPPSTASAIQFAGGFLSLVLERSISESDLRGEPERYASMLNTFIDNHRGQRVTVESKTVGVGLDTSAVELLTSARNELQGRTPNQTITILTPTFLSRFEFGPQFTAVAINGDSDKRTAFGFGGRVRFSAYRGINIETSANFFPQNSKSVGTRTNGRMTQMMFGSDKMLRSFRRFSTFVNGQVGFVSLSGGSSTIASGNSSPVNFQQPRLTHLAINVGGSLRYYPQTRRNVMLRFDFGDTLIRYGTQRIALPNSPNVITIPSATKHNFQFTHGVGFWFN